jgi:hypothetical protein
MPSRPIAAALAVLSLAAPMTAAAADPLDAVAERYVKLVLAVGSHRPDYVDAYHGPAEWRAEAERAGKRPLPALAAEADAALAAARAAAVAPGDRDRELRRGFLAGQLAALRAFVGILSGDKLSFDDEARALYGVAPPRRDLAAVEAAYAAVRARLDALLPGQGPIPPRYAAWKEGLAVPRERIEPVMRAAIEEVRRRTLPHVALPARERFSLALVTGKPWGAYNWYRGKAESLIEVNTTLPFHAYGAVGLAAHEGYPGHHVMNALQEARLAVAKGRVEHLVYPLFSPISLVAEGSAEAGVALVFPGAERLAFERDVLFPLAGLDPAEAPRAARVRAAFEELRGLGHELARRYLDGELTADQARAWLVAHALQTPEEAAQRLKFFDGYRSYVVNYGYGKELVREWLDARAGADPAARWAAFVDLVGSPRLPADLVARPAR